MGKNKRTRRIGINKEKEKRAEEKKTEYHLTVVKNR
jgi:hypothetical protein